MTQSQTLDCAALHGFGVTCVTGCSNLVTDCTFKIEPGELVALVGPNGAGKTTLLRAITGMRPYKGTIAHGTDDLFKLSRRERATLISYLPQGGRIHWPLSVYDVVGLGRLAHTGEALTRAEQYNSPVEQAMDRCGLTEYRDRNAMDLSGGEKARVLLARALAVQSKFLLADEPLASLDPKHQLTIMQCLRDVADAGSGVLAVMHDLNLALRFADRILLMKEGLIVGDDTPGNLLHQRRFDNLFEVQFLPVPDENGCVHSVVINEGGLANERR